MSSSLISMNFVQRLRVLEIQVPVSRLTLHTPFSRSRSQDARAVGNQSATDFAVVRLQCACRHFLCTVTYKFVDYDIMSNTCKGMF